VGAGDAGDGSGRDSFKTGAGDPEEVSACNFGEGVELRPTM
jgi:hypothetical protein